MRDALAKARITDITEHLSKEDADYVDHPVLGDRCADCTMFDAPARCTLVRGEISPDGHCMFFERIAGKSSVGKSSDHPGGADLHVMPENAIPINLAQPYPDPVTRANLWHVAWAMVHDGEFAPTREQVPVEAIIPTQQVVDKLRVAKHEAALREGEDVEPEQKPPLVLYWDEDYFLLGGHHGMQAARNLGIKVVDVDLMKAPR